jgi:hypothetical protein
VKVLQDSSVAGVVRLTLLYINSEAVIPEKAGIQEKTGFRVKPGMTIKVKGLLTQYATASFDCAQDSLLRIIGRENRLK